MRYRELVARISEVTRTLVDRGRRGEFDEGSSRFRAGTPFPESVKIGLMLEIEDGDAPGHYSIVAVDHEAGVLTLAQADFPVSNGELSWVIYEPGVNIKDVRKVLRAFPSVIMECDEGEQVRTYLGTFRITRRKRKRVKDPQGRWTFSEPKVVARIRPGKRLQREVDEPSSGLSILSEADLDEDP